MTFYSSKRFIEPWQDPELEPYVRIENLTKKFETQVAVDNVNLSIYQGEFFSLLGGSGSGKTTLLRMIAGFETPTEGQIFIDGVDMTHIPPYERPVNMMFQNYALFPHMTVEQNIAFGLKQDQLPRRVINTRVEEALHLTQMSDFARRKPHQLSGGQKQRVALARSLVKRPKLLLLDEPLGALDKKLREETQFELVNIQEQVGITFVVVTHDQEEAMTMSSRIAVMDSGWIAQIGTSNEIYEYPSSKFIAEFIGSVNMIEGRVDLVEKEFVTIIGNDVDNALHINHSVPVPVGTQVWVAVRPEKIKIEKIDPNNPPPIHEYNSAIGVVNEIAYKGNLSVYVVELDSGIQMRVTAQNTTPSTERPITWDDKVYLTWQSGAAVVLTH